MSLRDNEGFAIGHKPEPDRGLKDAGENDSPDEYEEFVSRLTPWWIVILSIAPPLFFLLRAGGASVLSYIVPAVSVVAAVVQYVTQKQIRLIIAAHGLYYQHGRTRRAIYWGDVDEVIIDKATRRLDIRVHDQQPLRIHLKPFPDSRRLKDLLLSYVAQEARVIETPAVGSPLFPAVIVWVFSGFAVLVLAFSPEALPFRFLVLGAGIGVVAGVVYVRFVRPTRKARFWTNLGCLLFLVIALVAGIWLLVALPARAARGVIIRALCVVLGLASAFAFVVAVVRAPGTWERNVEPASPTG